MAASSTYSFRLTAEGFKAFQDDLQKIGESSVDAQGAIYKLIQSSPQLAGALDKAREAASRTREELESTGKGVEGLATRGSRSLTLFGNTSVTAFRMAARQAGLMVQDFGRGADMLTTLATRGTAAASVLTGGFAGVAIALAGLAAQYVFTTRETEAHSDATDGLAEALDELDRVTRSATERAQAHAEAQRQNSLMALEDARAFNEERLALAQLDLEYARSAAETARRLQQAGQRRGSLRGGVAGQAAEGFGEETSRLEATVELFTRQLRDAEERLDRLRAAPLDLPRAGGAGGRAGRSPRDTAADDARRQADELRQVEDAYRRLAATLDPAIAAQQQYNDAVATLDAALQRGLISQEEYSDMVARVAERLRDSSTDFSQSFERFVESSMGMLENAAMTGKNLREVFASLDRGLAALIMRLAVIEPMMNAIKTAFRNAGGLEGIFSGLFGGFGTSGNFAGDSPGQPTGTYHAGGDVGTAPALRRVPAAVFAGAPRFHMGIDEVPAILQRGERVLTREQARRADQTPMTFAPVVNVTVRDTAATPARIAAAVAMAVQQSKEAVAVEADRGGSYARRLGRR